MFSNKIKLFTLIIVFFLFCLIIFQAFKEKKNPPSLEDLPIIKASEKIIREKVTPSFKIKK